MISERAFGPSLSRRRMAHERELSFGNYSVSVSRRSFNHSNLLASEQGGEHKFRHVFRERSNCRKNQSGRAAEENCYGKRLTQLLGFVIMKAAAFVNLPVQARRARIVNLHTIHA